MTAGKGSKQRPTDQYKYDNNHTRIFGKSRLQKAIEADWDKCPYCGYRMEEPCDEPPPDMCSKALDKILCEDEGCPNSHFKHICINKKETNAN